MEPNYLPTAERRPDEQYKERLELIRKKGRYTKSRFQTEGTFTHLNLPAMEFDLSNGFPILTERKITFWRKPIQELFAFLNGVRDAKVLAEEWGVNWWMDKWATPEKCDHFKLAPYDMGPGSYGPGFVQANQVDNFVRQIRTYPELRTHVIKSWIPQYCLQHNALVRQVVVAPCHGDVQATIINGKLTVRMQQRSSDFPIGIPANMIQYAAFTLGLGSITGYEPETFIHGSNDSQIYERHLPDVEELLRRPSHLFPTMHLTEEGRRITDIRDFRAKHFELREYEAEPAMTLADAVI